MAAILVGPITVSTNRGSLTPLVWEEFRPNPVLSVKIDPKFDLRRISAPPFSSTSAPKTTQHADVLVTIPNCGLSFS